MKPVRVIDREDTQLVIVGLGGTGGYVLQQVARLLYGLKEQGKKIPGVLLIDGDAVEEKNLLRQYFLPQDVGKKKAEVLARRYGASYGIEITSYPEYLTGETEIGSPRPWQSGLIREGAVVVACVDNAGTRQVLDEKLREYQHIVYLDVGNAAVDFLGDTEHMDRYDLHRVRESGWDGQVVCGVRFGGRDVIPFAGEVFPDLIEPDGDDDRVPGEVEFSCGEVVVSNPQRLMTNLMAATAVLSYLHTLLTEGTIVNHRTFFDARRGYVRSDPAIVHMLEVSV